MSDNEALVILFVSACVTYIARTYIIWRFDDKE